MKLDKIWKWNWMEAKEGQEGKGKQISSKEEGDQVATSVLLVGIDVHV